MTVQVPGLEISLHPTDEGTVVTVSGEVDLATAPALDEALADAMASRPAQIVADLTDVEFADSTCVHLLVRARADAVAAGIGFRAIAPEGSAGVVFSLCGAEHLLEPVLARPQPRFVNEWSC